MTFDEAFIILMRYEGGYVNHPKDPGGTTNFGITQKVARANGYKGDMRDLPIETAKDIAKRLYWDSIHADKLPEFIRYDVFDAAFNSGVRQAILWLQAAVGSTQDGVIGPETTNAACMTNASVLSKRYNGRRLEFLTGLPTFSIFGRGWARRIADNLKR